jgi:chromosomal replication initiator protein
MVAERVGRYGPLLLHGPAGVGKSHLLYAMMRELRRHGSSLRPLRLTAEQFTTEFLDALNRRTLAGFRQKYRTVDVLLIDDIQFIASKRATLDELLVTIDSLHERGKQVVLTCDANPQEILKLSSDLAMRISGGLAVPMELPDFATRQALVRRIVGDMHPTIGMAIDDEVVVVIATQVAGSARQLSGAINRLIVTSEALKKPLTADLARSILSDYMQQITPTVRLPDIQKAVCEVFGVDTTSLKSASKTRSVAEPRMLAMALSCNLTRSALGEISEFFGRRSHSTVISAQRKIEKMISHGDKVTLANQSCTMEEAIRRVQAVLRRA